MNEAFAHELAGRVENFGRAKPSAPPSGGAMVARPFVPPFCSLDNSTMQ